jgi:hypothetical protein
MLEASLPQNFWDGFENTGFEGNWYVLSFFESSRTTGHHDRLE